MALGRFRHSVLTSKQRTKEIPMLIPALLVALLVVALAQLALALRA
ncbi:MAG TPA: hypothetical protein VLJ76_05680 [Gaiellaceae bacterium]|nr:hypothetical protein [Gaiellaceae bacterium]